VANYTIAQLKTEITTDPKSIGYSASFAMGDDTGVASKLNSTYAGVGTVWHSSVPAASILGGMLWSEVSAWSQTQWEAVSTLLIPLKIDASNANIRNMFSGIFSAATASLANISAAAKIVNPSRAQELWGDTTVVPVSDVTAARNS
jgi:hypothetical protein